MPPGAEKALVVFEVPDVPADAGMALPVCWIMFASDAAEKVFWLLAPPMPPELGGVIKLCAVSAVVCACAVKVAKGAKTSSNMVAVTAVCVPSLYRKRFIL